MALAGLLPVPEIQFRKYAEPATEQINDTGTMRWRTHNRFAAPMVLRVPGGIFKCGDPWHSQANAVQFAGSATCAWVLMALFETPRAVWSATALLTLAHLTFVVSLGGMALLFTMLRTGVAGQVSANFYLVPGMALLLAWAFLGETVEPLAIPGFLVTCAGVFLVNRRARQAGVAAGKG